MGQVPNPPPLPPPTTPPGKPSKALASADSFEGMTPTLDMGHEYAAGSRFCRSDRCVGVPSPEGGSSGPHPDVCVVLLKGKDGRGASA